MEILSPQDYHLWDLFVQKNNGSFLQCSEWTAESFFIVAKQDENGDIVGGCKVEERMLWMGKVIWVVRRVAIFNFKVLISKEDLLNFLFEKAKKRGKVVVIRIQGFQASSFKLQASRPRFLFHVEDPKTTLMVDLLYTEDELLQEMHEKTRYNIRLAEKKGVVVREGSVEELFDLYSATNQRKGLKGFGKSYFEKLFKLQASSFKLQIFTAYNNTIPLASNLLVCFGDTVTYLFGGTADEHRELMAPHLLHWECIKWAKSNEFRWYDFWGIEAHGTRSVEHETRIRNWEGITRFKKGFVSEKTDKVVEYGETIDVIVNSFWYHFFSWIKKIL